MKFLLFAGMPPSEFDYFLALALLALLNVMKRGRSLLAHGAFIGLLLGFLVGEWQKVQPDWSWNYFRDIDHVGWGLFIGLLVGGAVRIYFNILEENRNRLLQQNQDVSTGVQPPDQAQQSNPFLWSGVFGVTGLYLSLFAILFFKAPYHPAVTLLMGSLLTGALTGLAFGPLLRNHPRISKSLEMGMGIVLLVGISLIFYWKIVWPSFS